MQLQALAVTALQAKSAAMEGVSPTAAQAAQAVMLAQAPMFGQEA